ncbi:TPA: ATP-binding cassette domain-containing protein [Escherichia coli]|nr:ATP-binding cassette domain-containing protein [Escherichia coli]HBB1225812.1 ATP-binding cassette domain-containing protein [Escherichia coli]
MLSLRQVTLEVAQYSWFGTKRWLPLVQDISFNVTPGEMVALVGGSGEGKSLLLQCLLDLLPENLRFHGDIILDGDKLNSDSMRVYRGNQFCYIPQSVQALNPLHNVESHLSRWYSLSGKHPNTMQIEQLLHRNQLETDILRAFPRQLSGGMAKRILASHASFSRARYILADEVTAWLDITLARQILNHLRNLCEQGKAVIWVAHDLTLAAQYADRIVALHQGKLSDNVSREQLVRGDVSEWLQRQWQCLPEHNQLFV